MKIISILQKKGLNKSKMNDFIEINSHGNQVLINLRNVISIMQSCNPYIEGDYLVYLVNSKCYEISKEQYETIKAKLIGNSSKK